MLAVSRDAAAAFASPVRVNSSAGDPASAARSRRESRGGNRRSPEPLITVTWNAKDDGTEIKTARSRDGGRTFTAARSLQSKGAVGDRGWQASAMDRTGKLHTIWLDHRVMAADKASGTHAGHPASTMVWRWSRSRGCITRRMGSPTRALQRRVYCCKTAMALGPKGEIYAAWRHVFAGSMRDMGFTVSRDGGKSFAPLLRVNQDGWSIQGCPDDGPAMAVDAKAPAFVCGRP